MLFGDQTVSRVYFGDQLVSAMYFGDVLAWTGDLGSRLSTRVLHLNRKTALFGLLPPPLTGLGYIELQRKSALFASQNELSGGQNIELNRKAATFVPTASLDSGDIVLNRKITSFQIKATLSGGQGIQLLRKSGTFGYVLNTGTIHLNRKAATLGFKATLTARTINLNRKTASFQQKTTLSGANPTINLNRKSATLALVAVPWTPASLTGLYAWHEAADTASITSASSLASQWNDKSGAGRHLTEATNKPGYSSSVQVNGINALDCGPAQRPPGSPQKTMGWASAITTVKSAFAVVGTGLNSATSGGGFLFGSSGSTFPFHRAGTGSQEGYLAADPLLNITFSDAALQAGKTRRNGITIEPTILGFTGQSSWNIIGYNSNSAAIGSFNRINQDRNLSRGGARWGAIVLTTTIISDDDKRRLEGYWAPIYGFTLPEIHPYADHVPTVGDTVTERAITAHRYWQFESFMSAGGVVNTGMSEFRMYETIGGSDVVPSGTLTATVAPTSGSLADMQDGNLTTTQAQWASNVLTLNIDFGAGVTKAINQIGIGPNKDAANRTPKVFMLRWSDDGVTYHDAWGTTVFSAYSIGTLKKIDATSL